MASSSSRKLTDTRLYLLGAVLLLWCSAICLRLVYLQIFRYGSFEQRAQHQQQRTVEVSARRGIIYDRAGRELAMSVSVDSAFAVPTEIPDLAGTVSLISRITKSDPRELLARCKAARTFCWAARKADAETASRIRALNLRGIYFQKESKRFYPKGDLALSSKPTPCCFRQGEFCPRRRKSRAGTLRSAGRSPEPRLQRAEQGRKSELRSRQKPWRLQTRHAETRARTPAASDVEHAGSMLWTNAPTRTR